jgi:hypothetical protein
MLDRKCVIVVLPVYHAAKTLEQAIAQVPLGIVDEPIHELFLEASSINVLRSVSYGCGVLDTAPVPTAPVVDLPLSSV